jgi:hypothetical protein
LQLAQNWKQGTHEVFPDDSFMYKSVLQEVHMGPGEQREQVSGHEAHERFKSVVLS